jgi:hypothetical protein
MKTRFITFESYHGKQNIGSTNIRVHQLIRYWKEAGIYRFGENADVLIFQKVYITPDYRFPEHFKGIKILDICDADWMTGMTCVRETIEYMDAVTCPTETLRDFLQQMTDKPVYVVPDRYDIDTFPKPKSHIEDAKSVVWYGYRHNADLLRPAMNLIEELGLKLIVIADDDPMAWQWISERSKAESFRSSQYQYIKHSDDAVTVHNDLQRADFVILPKGDRPVDKFKSNNKTTRAILCGLPVAYSADDMRRFMQADERKRFIDDEYDSTKKEYDVRKSVSQYNAIIKIVTESKYKDSEG